MAGRVRGFDSVALPPVKARDAAVVHRLSPVCGSGGVHEAGEGTVAVEPARGVAGTAFAMSRVL